MRVRSDEVFTTEVDGEAVILDARTSTYFSTNVVGTAILQLLQEDRSLDQVVDVIATEFEVVADVARRDCQRFVDQLSEHGLLRVEH